MVQREEKLKRRRKVGNLKRYSGSDGRKSIPNIFIIEISKRSKITTQSASGEGIYEKDAPSTSLRPSDSTEYLLPIG